MGLKFNLVQKVNPHDRDAEKKWYAVPSSDSPLSAKALAKAATANTSTAPIEMEAAMEHLANYIPQQLLQGHTVKVSGLGTFRVIFKSSGVSHPSEFNASTMIKEPRILFTPEPALRESVINGLSFENGGVLKDGIRYASVADYRKAMGEDSSSSTDDDTTSGTTGSGGTDSSSGDEGNPL